MITRDTIVDAIKRVATERNAAVLRFRDFQASTGITRNDILQHFDSWSDACTTCGIRSGISADLRVNPLLTPEACVAELRRVASLLKKDTLTREEFTAHSEMSSITPRRRFGGWPKALIAAGLKPSTFEFPEDVPIERLIPDFLGVVKELHAIPTLNQLSRRSLHGRYVYSVKHGGYPNFKLTAISLLLQNTNLPPDLRSILQTEYCRLSPKAKDQHPQRDHQHGRMLGFRAFAHVPTYEMEVVSLFSTVAEELGFEIICLRGEFPDCEANRRIPGKRQRFKKCLIEFELKSSDFWTHKHPASGCDLVVCWEHDWQECPVEVLELQKAIKSLPGWK